MGLILLDSGFGEVPADLFAGHAPRIEVRYDNGPFSGEEAREEFRHAGSVPTPNTTARVSVVRIKAFSILFMRVDFGFLIY